VKPPLDDDSLERAIIGALRGTIHDHGPITAEWISSAAKRILGALGNARADALARALGRRRWEGVSEKERTKHQAAAASSYWKAMTPEERSAEMKRRKKVQKKRA
jgi:hypothetical protein